MVFPLPKKSKTFKYEHFLNTQNTYASGGQRIGVSASASVLKMNIQGWFPLGLTGLISLLSKEIKYIYTLYIHYIIVFFLKFFSIIVYYKILNIVLCIMNKRFYFSRALKNGQIQSEPGKPLMATFEGKGQQALESTVEEKKSRMDHWAEGYHDATMSALVCSGPHEVEGA